MGLFAGTLVGVLWLNDAPVIGRGSDRPAGAADWDCPPWAFLARAVEPALILALIGSVVSLLTCLVADSLTRTSHDPDRELIGQGVGNAAAGLIGGLPGAGTPVYTVPNIRARAGGPGRRGRYSRSSCWRSCWASGPTSSRFRSPPSRAF